MKISLQRTLFEVVDFLLALLLIIPVGVFLEQLCGFRLYTYCFVPCASMLSYLLGRLSLSCEMKKAMLLCGLGVVLSTGLSIVLTVGVALVSILLPLITVFFSVFLYFSARKAAYTIYAPMAVGGVIMHLFILLCCAGFEWSSAVTDFTSTIAICFFLLTLFAFSAVGLRRSMHRGSGAKRVTYPAGMQMGNFLLVVGFVLVAAFISNIYPLFVIFSKAFGVIMSFLLSGFSFFISLFDRRTISTQTEETTTSVAAEDNIMNVEAKGEASWLTMAVEIFAFICVVLLLLYLLYRLMQRMKESGLRLPGFVRSLRDKFAPVVDEDYVDEAESLFDMKKMLADTRSNMKKALKRIRERPQRLDDFQDPKLKVRFAFQQLLKKVKTRNPKAVCQTPNEIYNQEYEGEADFRTFMDYYNQAKYSTGPLPDDAGECARAILKQKL